MAIAALPDVLGALIVRLRSFDEILTFVTTNGGYTADATTAQRARPRIATDIQSFWQLGTWPVPPTAPKGSWSLLVDGPIGDPLPDPEAGILSIRVDLHCYSPSKYEGIRFWRQVHPCLCPPRHQGIPTRFVAAGVRFTDVAKEGGPNWLVEDITRRGKVVATYICRFSELSV